MHYWYDMGGPGWSWLGWLFLVVIIVLVVYLIIKALSSSSENSRKEEDSTTEALKILNERYARGEISDEEYVHRKENLTKNNFYN